MRQTYFMETKSNGALKGLKPVTGKLSEAKKVFVLSVSHFSSQTPHFPPGLPAAQYAKDCSVCKRLLLLSFLVYIISLLATAGTNTLPLNLKVTLLGERTELVQLGLGVSSSPPPLHLPPPTLCGRSDRADLRKLAAHFRGCVMVLTLTGSCTIIQKLSRPPSSTKTCTTLRSFDLFPQELSEYLIMGWKDNCFQVLTTIPTAPCSNFLATLCPTYIWVLIIS